MQAAEGGRRRAYQPEPEPEPVQEQEEEEQEQAQSGQIFVARQGEVVERSG